MIKSPEKWQKWEAEWQKNTPIDIEENFEILTRLIEQAKLLGKWPPESPLEGIEVDIKIAKVMNTYVENSVGKTGENT